MRENVFHFAGLGSFTVFSSILIIILLSGVSWVIFKQKISNKWVGVVAWVVCTVTVAIVSYIITLPNFSTLTVSNNSLYVKSLLYKTSIALEDIDVGKVYQRDNSEDLDLDIRTNGISLAGLNVGWFRLSDGTKAFLFVTNSNKEIVVIPTKRDYSIIVTAEDSSKLLNTLVKI